MARHHSRRAPRKNTGFSWGRFPLRGCTDYRLFRRDYTGALHVESRTFNMSEPPAHIARALRLAKRQLRDRVDTIDLQAMEVLHDSKSHRS